MFRILWNSKSAMAANQDRLTAIGNNVANSDTDGYKSVDVEFKDLVYESLNKKGYPVTEGKNLETGSGVRATNANFDFSNGDTQETGINTDMAIQSDGFFRVTRSDGSKAYERAGSFNLDANANKLVDKAGNVLDIQYTSNNRPQLTDKNFTVDSEGNLSVGSQVVGKINLYDFVGNQKLTPVGNNLYANDKNLTEYVVAKPKIIQGSLESSNVNLGKEMSDMILTQRAFEMNSEGLKTADQMWEMANNLRGR